MQLLSVQVCCHIEPQIARQRFLPGRLKVPDLGSTLGVNPSSVAHSSWRGSHSQHTDDALSRRQSWALPALGSNNSNSSACGNDDSLGMDPHSVRHLCLQELELLWSEDCTKVRYLIQPAQSLNTPAYVCMPPHW